MAAPVESKVYGALTGGTAGTVLSTFVLWILGVYAWHAPNTSEAATAAIAAVPYPVVGLVGGILGLGGVFFGGWLAKHSPRIAAELEAAPAPVWDVQPPADGSDTDVDPDAPVLTAEVATA